MNQRKICETEELHIYLQPNSFANRRIMRKLKLQVQMTIDGFISGQNGEMDWMKFPWTEDILNYIRELTEMQKFSVLDVRNFECGIIAMVYKPI